MKRMVISALATVLSSAALGAVPAVAEASDIDGKAKFLEHKCIMCHSVETEGMVAKARVEKMKGPDLSGYTSEVEFSKMAAYLRAEIAVAGKKHTKPFKGTDEELQAIIDWLGSLEAQE